MQIVRRFLFALCAVCCFAAYAQQVCYEWMSSDYPQVGWKQSPAAVCGAIQTIITTANAPAIAQGASYSVSAEQTVQGTPGTWRCKFVYTSPPAQGGQTSTQYFGLTSRIAASCPNTCTDGAGSSKTVNVTAGYSKNPDNWRFDFKPDGTAAPTGYDFPLPAIACNAADNCTYTRSTGDEIVDAWQSTQATNKGMYRLSYDLKMTKTATQCTPTTPDKDMTDPSKAAPATCDGTEGYFNGKKTCVPKAFENVNVLPKTSSGNTKLGNPTAGSTGGTTNIPAVNGDGGNKGGPPSTQDGSVRTGTGIVVTPAPSTPGSGTVTAPPAGQEQAACGAPGQPKCGIDESGTPTGLGVLKDDAIKSSLTNLDTAIDNIKNKTDKDTSFAIPDFLPNGACQPWDFGEFPIIGVRFVLNICPWKPAIDAVLSFLWVTATFFIIVAMMGRVMMGPSR